MLTFVVLALSILASAHAEDVPQCKCSEFEPCLKKLEEALKPCIDFCAIKEHLGEGHPGDKPVNFPAVKECINAKYSLIESTIDCFRKEHPNMCAKDAPKQVPKTDVEVLKTAAVNEVLSIFDKAGSLAEVAPLMSVAKKMNNCVLKCAEKKTDNCYKAMNCGLDLGTESEIFKSAKECAQKSGITGKEMQGVCECAVSNGMTHLAGVCGKLPA